MTAATKTKDEQDTENPYKPFPKKPYIKNLVEYLTKPLEKTTIRATYKSRTMMGSWTHAAVAFHYAATHPATRVVVQSKDEARSVNMVGMMKTLWSNTHPRLQAKWKLGKRLDLQPYDAFYLENDSSVHGMVGTPTKIKSLHPTIYIADEAAVMDNLDDCMAEVLGARVPMIYLLSSAWLGYMHDLYESCKPLGWEEYQVKEQEDHKTLELEVKEKVGKKGKGKAKVKEDEDLFSLSTPPPATQGFDLLKHPDKDIYFLRLHYTADPVMTAEELGKLRPKYPSDALWQREMEINPRSAMGALVFPEFTPRTHVVLPEQIPERLCVWMAIDPHPRTPHAFLWIGVDRFNDLYVFREYWPSIAYGTVRKLRDDERENQYTIQNYVESIAKLEGNKVVWTFEKDSNDPVYGTVPEGGRGGSEYIMLRYMDQAGKAFRASGESQLLETYAKRYRRYGIQCSDPRKSHQVGEDAIREVLKPRPHELHGTSPRLLISSDCRETIAELMNYRYRESSDRQDKDQNQEATDFRTHMVDLLRYILTANVYYDQRFATTVNIRRRRLNDGTAA